MSHVLAKMYENESHAPYKCNISHFPANIPIFCSVLPANSLVKILRYFASRIASKIGLCLPGDWCTQEHVTACSTMFDWE